jgi:hypothetical protein
MDTEYNGLTNKATWAASLWLNNDEAMYRRAVRDGDPSDIVVRHVFTVLASSMAKHEVTKAGGVSTVNWQEIAKGFAS